MSDEGKERREREEGKKRRRNEQIKREMEKERCADRRRKVEQNRHDVYSKGHFHMTVCQFGSQNDEQ